MKVGGTLVFRQDYWYWTIIHSLVVEQHFRILRISQNHQEVWLQSNRSKGPNVVRMLRYDLDWSNWMQRDIEVTSQKAELMRKRLYKRNLNAVNIYISTYPPVDDWKFRTEEPLIVGNNKQTSLQTIVVSSNTLQQDLADLSAELQIPLTIEDEGILFDYTKLELLKSKVISVSNHRIKEEKKLFTYGKPYFTYIFIFIQLLLFGVLELQGGSMDPDVLMKYGAKDNPSIIEGEWWRFITPIFIHIGFLHLLMNTLALYYLGTAVERIYGRIRFFLLYLFAGFTGSLASFVFSPAISAGASGAIFGCFGALLFFGVTHPSLFFRTMGKNIVGIILINIAIGFMIPGIDNAGHIGGLVGGFLASSIVHLPHQRKYSMRVLSVFITLILTLIMLYLGYTSSFR